MRATSLSTVCVCRPRRPTHEAYIPPEQRRRSNAQRESAGARQPSSPDTRTAASSNHQQWRSDESNSSRREETRQERGERRKADRKVSLSQTEPLYRERANNRNALSRDTRLPSPLTLVRVSTSSWLSYAAIECVLVVDLASRVVSFVSRSPSLVALLLPACLRVSLSPFLCVCTYVRSLLDRCSAWCGVWCVREPPISIHLHLLSLSRVSCARACTLLLLGLTHSISHTRTHALARLLALVCTFLACACCCWCGCCRSSLAFTSPPLPCRSSASFASPRARRFRDSLRLSRPSALLATGSSAPRPRSRRSRSPSA